MVTFEYKLPRDIHTWCQESDAIRERPQLQKILLENSDLIDVQQRTIFKDQIEYVYHYGLSDQGYTLLSLNSDMIRTLKLYTRLAEWPSNRK